MKKFLVGSVLLAIMAFGNACSKSDDDNDGGNPPPNPNTCTTAPSWTSTIKPIIAGNCSNTADCHGTGAPSGIVFWSGGDVSHAVVAANANRVKTQVVNKTMPKNGSLTAAQIQNISCWVDKGAPNN